VELAMRGARIVAFSTIYGCVQRPTGFDVDELLRLRAVHGDHLVEHLGAELRPAAELFDVEADVLVPGARIGVIDEARARSLRVRVVAPGANVPYTAGALDVLKQRGIPALADFICNSGATIGYVTSGLENVDQAVATVERRVRDLTRESLADPQGPLSGARRIAEAHLRTWLGRDQMPDGPAVAPYTPPA
jgi:glutamate dehydrogenase/leucine dehydrogenase